MSSSIDTPVLSDVEMTRLCAAAIEPPPTSPGGSSIWGVSVQFAPTHKVDAWVRSTYDPLHNDEQAMALLKSFQMDVKRYLPMVKGEPGAWEVTCTIDGWDTTRNESLNRAIVECVAKCQTHYPRGVAVIEGRKDG